MTDFTDDQFDAVREAAAALNPEDDAHWNKDGHPSCNVLTEACGFSVTRDLVAAADLPSRPDQGANADDTPAEEPRQATLAECNAMMKKTEIHLEKTAKKDAAIAAAAALKEIA